MKSVNNCFWLTAAGLLVTLGGALFSSPASAQAAMSQLIISSSIPIKSTRSSAVRDAHPAAVAEASKNAWRLLRTRPEFSSKVVNLGLDQDAQMAQDLSARCTISDLDQAVDEDKMMLTSRFRFDCDQQAIQIDLGKLSAQLAQAAPPGDHSNITFMFFAQADTSSRSYEANVSQTSSEDAQSSQGSDTISKSRSVNSGSESNGGATPGNESAQKSGTSASRSASSTSTNMTAARSSTTGGNTVRQASEYTTKVSSPAALYKALTAVFTNADLSLIDYGDISANCKAPSVESIAANYGRLPPDQAMELSPLIRKQVMDAARTCADVSFLGYGVAKIGIGREDPVTGGRQVHILVSAQIWDIRKPIPIVVVSVPETDVSAVGPDDSIATSNALAQASNFVGQDVLNRMSARGVR